MQGYLPVPDQVQHKLRAKLRTMCASVPAQVRLMRPQSLQGYLPVPVLEPRKTRRIAVGWQLGHRPKPGPPRSHPRGATAANSYTNEICMCLAIGRKEAEAHQPCRRWNASAMHPMSSWATRAPRMDNTVSQQMKCLRGSQLILDCSLLYHLRHPGF